MPHWLRKSFWYHQACWANKVAPSPQRGWQRPENHQGTVHGKKQQQFVITMKVANLWRSKERFVKDVYFHPILSLYSEYNRREIEDLSGIKRAGRNINNLRYVDGIALMATSEADLQRAAKHHKWEKWISGPRSQEESTYDNLEESSHTNLHYKFEQLSSGTSENLQIFGNIYFLWWEVSASYQSQNLTRGKNLHELIKDTNRYLRQWKESCTSTLSQSWLMKATRWPLTKQPVTPLTQQNCGSWEECKEYHALNMQQRKQY